MKKERGKSIMSASAAVGCIQTEVTVSGGLRYQSQVKKTLSQPSWPVIMRSKSWGASV